MAFHSLRPGALARKLNANKKSKTSLFFNALKGAILKAGRRGGGFLCRFFPRKSP
jgi:hypothetical protein